jgi:hypothetical protein
LTRALGRLAGMPAGISTGMSTGMSTGKPALGGGAVRMGSRAEGVDSDDEAAPQEGGGQGPAAYPRDKIPTEVKLAFFNEMRHAYGRTALMLSGGAVLGLYHVGVAKALFHAGLLPRVLSGASAGAIVAATLATKTNEELVATKVFEGQGVPLEFFRVNDRSFNGVYLETVTLRHTIQGCVGHETFQVWTPTIGARFSPISFELLPPPPPHRRRSTARAAF